VSHSTTSLSDLTITLYSTYIHFQCETRATAVDLYIIVGSVPTGELLSFNEKFQMSLRRIVEEGIDMDRMAMVINRDERKASDHLFRENSNINGPIIIDAERIRVK
jgi:hypothetical protein